MALHNINLLQNPIDINSNINSDNNSINEKYLIQSLANLGQRMGIKGDGIIYKSFTFEDIFQINEHKNPNDYIGEILVKPQNDKLKCYFNIINKKDLLPLNNSSVSLELNNIYIKNKINLDIKLNNIDLYSEESSLTYVDNNFINIIFGKIIGTNEDDINNKEIIYNIYNTTTNELLYGIRAYYLYNDNISNYYIMYIIKKDNNIDNKYTLNTYLFNSSVIKDIIIKQKFEDAFSFNVTADDNIFISQLINGFTDIDNLFKYNSETDSTLFGMFINHPINSELNAINETVNLIYNSENNEQLSIISDISEIEITNNIFNKGAESLIERINFLNTDIKYLYPATLKYYSEDHYTNDKETLYKTILYNIYNYLDSFKKDKNKYYSLYIPLDYIFKYTCNSNNTFNIFNSTDIFITLTHLIKNNNSNVYNELFNQNTSLIYDYDFINKIKNICFSFNYNIKYTDYISHISILDIYTLPYITDQNTWSINDINTNISVLGKDAGNPNIILAYNYIDNNEIKINFLSGANIEKIYKSTFKDTSFIVNPQSNYLSSGNIENDIECKCKIPVITNENSDLFKYSIIIMLCDKTCINIKDNNKLLNNIYTSLWTMQINNNNAEFVYVTTNELNDSNAKNYALDISYLLNINNIINTYLENSLSNNTNIKFNSILLDANQNIMNQEYIDNIFNCSVIKNEPKEYYKNSIKEIFNNTDDKKTFLTYFDFNNQLNLNIKYNNKVNSYFTIPDTIEKKYITSSKYNVSNTLYPIYSKMSNISYKTIYLDEYTYKNTEYNKLINNYTLKSDEILTTSTSIESNHNIITPIKKPYQAKKYNYNYVFGKKNNNEIIYFYNEYLPNTNVPMLDFKEILLTNSNTLNRLNVLSFNKNGDVYYSYLGTQYDINSEKNIFTIGTSDKNINIGSATLIDYTYTDSFKQQNEIDINFNNIKLNGNANIKNILELNLNQLKLYNFNNIKTYLLDTELCGQLSIIKNDIKIIYKDNLYEAYVNPQNIDSDKLFYKVYINSEDNNIPTALIYINLNLLLNPYLDKIFNNNLNNNSQFIFEYNVNNDQSIEDEIIYKHSKILKINNNYLLELSCNNYGTLSCEKLSSDENDTKIHMITDNIKFIFYQKDSNKYIKYTSINKPFIYKYNYK